MPPRDLAAHAPDLASADAPDRTRLAAERKHPKPRRSPALPHAQPACGEASGGAGRAGDEDAAA